jgi:predicted DNA-binding protein with PD1-like motif
MELFPLRLAPGADLRRALEDLATSQGAESAFVVAGIGSLDGAHLRLAGADTTTSIAGPVELLSISGTLTPAGAHLHMSVADAGGRVHGGHVVYGNVVRTTAEILLARLSHWSLTRELDPATGFKELLVRRRE